MDANDHSWWILQKTTNAAQILLEKGCQENDINTEYGPIVCALKIGSKYWFETLMTKYDSKVFNDKFHVLSEYIKSKFFDFELMKKIKGINVIIGAPIQTALSKHYEEVALYL